jgi:hypothetical protein
MANHFRAIIAASTDAAKSINLPPYAKLTIGWRAFQPKQAIKHEQQRELYRR